MLLGSWLCQCVQQRRRCSQLLRAYLEGWGTHLGPMNSRYSVWNAVNIYKSAWLSAFLSLMVLINSLSNYSRIWESQFDLFFSPTVDIFFKQITRVRNDSIYQINCLLPLPVPLFRCHVLYESSSPYAFSTSSIVSPPYPCLKAQNFSCWSFA